MASVAPRGYGSIASKEALGARALDGGPSREGPLLAELGQSRMTLVDRELSFEHAES